MINKIIATLFAIAVFSVGLIYAEAKNYHGEQMEIIK